MFNDMRMSLILLGLTLTSLRLTLPKILHLSKYLREWQPLIETYQSQIDSLLYIREANRIACWLAFSYVIEPLYFK